VRDVVENYYTAPQWPAVDGDAGICKDGATGGIVWILRADVDGARHEAGCRLEDSEVFGCRSRTDVVRNLVGTALVGMGRKKVLQEEDTRFRVISRMKRFGER